MTVPTTISTESTIQSVRKLNNTTLARSTCCRSRPSVHGSDITEGYECAQCPNEQTAEPRAHVSSIESPEYDHGEQNGNNEVDLIEKRIELRQCGAEVVSNVRWRRHYV